MRGSLKDGPTTARRELCEGKGHIVASVARAQHPHGSVRQKKAFPHKYLMFALSQKYPSSIKTPTVLTNNSAQEVYDTHVHRLGKGTPTYLRLDLSVLGGFCSG